MLGATIVARLGGTSEIFPTTPHNITYHDDVVSRVLAPDEALEALAETARLHVPHAPPQRRFCAQVLHSVIQGLDFVIEGIGPGSEFGDAFLEFDLLNFERISFTSQASIFFTQRIKPLSNFWKELTGQT